MNKKENLRVFIWVELAIWLMILIIGVSFVRSHRIKNMKAQTTYQIFLSDADGLIVGSPVKYMGVEIGYIDKIKIVGNDVYVRLLMSDKNMKLPQGVIATVEFYGLGGSKSLELYPPNQDSITSKKIIDVKTPQRLGDVISLLDLMFEKIDSISQRASFFATEMEDIYSPEKTINLENIQSNVNLLDKWLNLPIFKSKEKNQLEVEKIEVQNEHE